jgi:hypothetical protein
MPVVIQTRNYDEEFYKAMAGKAVRRTGKRGGKELYGDEGFEGFD